MKYFQFYFSIFFLLCCDKFRSVTEAWSSNFLRIVLQREFLRKAWIAEHKYWNAFDALKPVVCWVDSVLGYVRTWSRTCRKDPLTIAILFFVGNSKSQNRCVFKRASAYYRPSEFDIYEGNICEKEHNSGYWSDNRDSVCISFHIPNTASVTSRNSASSEKIWCISIHALPISAIKYSLKRCLQKFMKESLMLYSEQLLLQAFRVKLRSSSASFLTPLTLNSLRGSSYGISSDPYWAVRWLHITEANTFSFNSGVGKWSCPERVRQMNFRKVQRYQRIFCIIICPLS